MSGATGYFPQLAPERMGHGFGGWDGEKEWERETEFAGPNDSRTNVGYRVPETNTMFMHGRPPTVPVCPVHIFLRPQLWTMMLVHSNLTHWQITRTMDMEIIFSPLTGHVRNGV